MQFGRKEQDITTPVDGLHTYFQEKILALNDLIIKESHSDVCLIPKVASHIFAASGKRIRPLLTLAAAEMCGYKGGNRDVTLAACVEFVHTATLLHDDVIDNSDERRGGSAAHKIWGNKTSILVGDFLFTKLFQMLVDDGSLPVLKVISKVSSDIIEGEVAQLSLKATLDATRVDYFQVVQLKTASLFQASAEVGAVVAGSGYDQALHCYGQNIGIAFQIVDDILDYASCFETLGKPIGNDFQERLSTLPIIVLYEEALRNGRKEEQTILEECFVHGNISANNFKKVSSMLRTHNIFGTCFEVAMSYVIKAKHSLSIFPDSFLRKTLFDLAEYTVLRTR